MSEQFKAAIEKHGLSVKAVFVPFSQSRNAANDPGNKPGSRSLNWRVTLVRDGRDIITTDYSAGVGHCPSYKQMARWTLDYVELIVFETERGKTAYKPNENSPYIRAGKDILPNPLDVIYSLVMDCDVLDYADFEEWAESFGYDTDSRNAESIYKHCLEIALKVRAGIGESALSELREAASDY